MAAASGSAPRGTIARRSAPRSTPRRRACALLLLAAQTTSSFAQAPQQPAAPLAPPALTPAEAQPDAVLVWGQGLFHVDLATRKVTEWLDASHVITKVCWMPDSGNNTDTVFVVEHGQVARLYADTGEPVSFTDPQNIHPHAVHTRHVIDLVANFTFLSAIELDRGPDGSGSGHPFWAAAYAPTAWSNAASDPGNISTSVIDLQGPGTPLDAAPDRLCANFALAERGEGAEVFVALSPAQGLGPRLWNGKGEAPRPQPQPSDAKWFVQGFAMATEAPRCFALMASPSSATRLMACDFPAGIASGMWTTLNTKLPVADPQIMSLYLCTSDGTRVLAGNGYRLDVIDGSSGGRRATLALQGVVRDSDAVVDACLVKLPHDDARHAFTPQAPSDVCLRDEAWICGLLRVIDAHGHWSGAMQVAAWDLQTGALLALIDVPSGTSQVTALPADTTASGLRSPRANAPAPPEPHAHPAGADAGPR